MRIAEELLQDIRYVGRAFRTAPGLAVVITFTVALGIGATTAMFTIVDGVLLRPLPYPSPDALVQIADVEPGGREVPATYREYRDWRERSASVLSEVATWFNTGEVLQENGNAEQLMGGRVSANLLAVIGTHPILGRTFRPDEDAAAGPRVVMLSEALWRGRFGADPAIVGRTIVLTGAPAVVVGVFASTPSAMLPSRWAWARGQAPDFYEPLRLDDKSSPPGLHWLDVVGRLRPGVTLDQARERITAMAANLQRDRGTKRGVHANPLAAALIGDFRTPLELLLGAVALLLLIACANVANLMLARTAARRRELALRAALGADRQRVLKLIVTESVLRALIGGALGIALAYAAVAAARAGFGAGIPRVATLSVDAKALVVAFLLSVAAGLSVGILPASRAARHDLVGGLREGAGGVLGSLSRDSLRRALITAEIALSFVLLVTGGLLGRSLVKLLSVPAGFDTRDLIAGFTWIPDTRYPDAVSTRAFYARLEQGVAASFGEHHVTLASDPPIAGGTDGTVAVEGVDYGDAMPPTADKRIVGTNYFQLLGARLLSGRAFRSTDEPNAPPVVVVNQSFVKQTFPHENPVGKRVSFGWGIDGFQTIVGVIADLREGPPNQPPKPAIYISSTQRPNTTMYLLVRTTPSPAAVATVLRAALKAVDPQVPLVRVQTMADVIAAGVRQQRLTMSVLAAFAVTAVLLTGVGLYGVISYSVTQRTRELGLRAALGAQRADLMRLVLGQTSMFALVGISLGLLGAFALRRIVSTLLFGVSASDPATLAATIGLLAAVALLAGLVPTVRDARADPLEAIRSD